MLNTKSLISVFVACVLAWTGAYAQNVAVENAVVDAARLLSSGGNPDGIAKHLERMALVDSTNDAVHYYLGLSRMHGGHFKEAEAALREAISLDPTNETYIETLAKCLSYEGKNDESSTIYLNLLEKNPKKFKNAQTLTILAEQELSRKKVNEALEHFNQALMFDPGYIPAILGQSEAYRFSGNLPGFFATLNKFTSAREVPADAKCDYVSQILKRVDGPTFRGWHAQLDSMVCSCVNAHPDDTSALILAGQWFYATDRKKEGEAYVDRLLTAHPDHLTGHWLRLSILGDKNDDSGVFNECKVILALAKGKPTEEASAYSILGDAYYNMGDRKNAYKCYEKSLKLNPDNYTVLNNYAYFLCLENKNLRKAEAMSRKVIEKYPDNPTYLDTYGWILHLQKKSVEAQKHFKHAMLYGGREHYEILLHYSQVLEAVGDKDLASYYKSLAESKKK